MEMKLLDKWSYDGLKVNDPGLAKYMNISPVIVPKTFGRNAGKQFHKSECNIVERLINRLYIPGHRGKKHLRSSDQCTGKTQTIINVVKDTFEIIEKKTKKNPIEVLIRAIENSALREEITSFQMGGVIVRKAVLAAPQRRIDLALRLITQGSYQKSFKNKKPMANALSEEIIGAYENNPQISHAIKEKERIEREAAGAR